MRRPVRDRLIAVFVFVCLIAFACGRKMPPVPPGDIPLPPVTGLMHRVHGDRVSLSWTAPSAVDRGDLAGYVVLRSVADPDDACDGCPLLFERAGSLGPSETRFSENVVPGRRYIYKIQPLSAARSLGRDSELVRFTVPETAGEGR
ncbi:hypothetical protein JCM14469_38490 [Desulfatiferula olefinivorans]